LASCPIQVDDLKLFPYADITTEESMSEWLTGPHLLCKSEHYGSAAVICTNIL
jgi:hypothetical protein